MTLCLCIYFVFTEKIILSLFKIDILNVTMYILTISTCPLETYAIRLNNLISMNIFCIIKGQFFFIIVKRNPKTNKSEKPFKNSDFFKPNFNERFLHNKG